MYLEWNIIGFDSVNCGCHSSSAWKKSSTDVMLVGVSEPCSHARNWNCFTVV